VELQHHVEVSSELHGARKGERERMEEIESEMEMMSSTSAPPQVAPGGELRLRLRAGPTIEYASRWWGGGEGGRSTSTEEVVGEGGAMGGSGGRKVDN
jgi:hypothetical protein